MPRDVCYYDGACGMCVRSTRILRRLDWFGRLSFQDLTALPPDQLPVDLDRALRGMPMRTGDGRVLVGFPAIRRALRRTPIGFIPAVALYLPLVSSIARFFYERIAAGRSREARTVDPTR